MEQHKMRARMLIFSPVCMLSLQRHHLHIHYRSHDFIIVLCVATRTCTLAWPLLCLSHGFLMDSFD